MHALTSGEAAEEAGGRMDVEVGDRWERHGS